MGNSGIVGHVQASTVEASTVTVIATAVSLFLGSAAHMENHDE